MKKTSKLLLAIAMCMCLVLVLAGCPTNKNEYDIIPDVMTSADGKYEIAVVTDVGDLKDKGFNQGTWEGAKKYASDNGKSYKYYRPANGSNATDQDRIDAMNQAVSNGAKVIVTPGYLQATALIDVASRNPDVKFVFIDGWPLSDADGNPLTNVVGVSYKEEESGFFAGYAAVMEGYTKLGFTGGGGGGNPACNRFGYGYIQGAEAAAKEKNVNVTVKYSYMYGSSFSASTELQTQISGWYNTGTEVVFACGGSMFNSVLAAANDTRNGKIIGVDTDQSPIIDKGYGKGITVTSAMKGLYPATYDTLTDIIAGKWDNYKGKIVSLGLVNGEDPTKNYVQLPMDTTQFGDTFTKEDYTALVKNMFEGKVTVSDDTTVFPTVTNSNVSDQGRIVG